MKAIILAAGPGSRLLPITKETPKCLIKVSDRCILDYQLEALHKLGITDIAIVTGYRSDKIKDHLKERSITFIHNDDYKNTNNAYSLWLTRDFVSNEHDGFVVINSDLIFKPEMLKALINSEKEESIVIERTVNPKSDMVKITMDGDRIIHMSKQIPENQAHAEAIGPVKFSKEGGKRFMDHIGRAVANRNKTNWFFYTISDYAKEHPFFGLQNPGFHWAEVDTSEDLELAKKIVNQNFT